MRLLWAIWRSCCYMGTRRRFVANFPRLVRDAWQLWRLDKRISKLRPGKNTYV